MDRPSFTGRKWAVAVVVTGLLGGAYTSPLPDESLTLVWPHQLMLSGLFPEESTLLLLPNSRVQVQLLAKLPQGSWGRPLDSR